MGLNILVYLDWVSCLIWNKKLKVLKMMLMIVNKYMCFVIVVCKFVGKVNLVLILVLVMYKI